MQDKTNTKENIDWAVEAFAGAMKDVLLEKKNMEKTYWSECDKQYLEGLLLMHTQDLAGCTDPKRYERVCIHIANLSMMLWQNSVHERVKEDE